jgi:hypothetical protein
MDKVRVIERSLRCYRLSWLSLIPLLGIVPALISFALFRKAGNEAGEQWNPARPFALIGLLIALIGLLISLILTGGLMIYCLRYLLG